MDIKLDYTGMAQMPSVDPACTVMHKIMQHIVLKIIAPLMGAIFFTHLQSPQCLLIIAGKSAEIKEDVTDAGVKQPFPEENRELMDRIRL